MITSSLTPWSVISMLPVVYWLNVLFQIRNLEARQNSLLMALEAAKQKNLRDDIAKTEFRLSDTELRLSQMRKSKAQVTDLFCMDETEEFKHFVVSVC
jgi:hypothetical protein